MMESKFSRIQYCTHTRGCVDASTAQESYRTVRLIFHATIDDYRERIESVLKHSYIRTCNIYIYQFMKQRFTPLQRYFGLPDRNLYIHYFMEG
jgi:hypothetical protein